jgi:hypothetical protein
MSEKAVGTDWKKKNIPTLRHATAMNEKWLEIKKDKKSVSKKVKIEEEEEEDEEDEEEDVDRKRKEAENREAEVRAREVERKRKEAEDREEEVRTREIERKRKEAEDREEEVRAREVERKRKEAEDRAKKVVQKIDDATNEEIKDIIIEELHKLGSYSEIVEKYGDPHVNFKPFIVVLRDKLKERFTNKMFKKILITDYKTDIRHELDYMFESGEVELVESEPSSKIDDYIKLEESARKKEEDALLKEAEIKISNLRQYIPRSFHKGRFTK